VSTGPYDVVVVKYGSRLSRRSEVFHNHAHSGLPDAEIAMDYYFWVIRGAGRVILVDTGFAASVGERRGRTVHADPRDLFPALGIEAADAPTIIVTHAHYDHIGNLAAFPQSPLIVARAELDFWRGPLSRRGEFGALTEPTEVALLLAAEDEGRVTAVDAAYDVAPGIRVIVAGGHTPGQLMVEVQTRTGTVLLASDVVHYDEELDTDVPFAFLSDLPELYRAFDVVRAARAAGTTILAGHEPGILNRYADRVPGLGDLTAIVGASPDIALERTSS